MTHIIKINPGHPEPDRIDQAVAILSSGGVIAFPTETFYGLGADARNEAAIEKIFGIKGRDFKNPILVVIGDERHLDAFAAEIPAAGAKAHGPLLARSADDRLQGHTVRPAEADGGKREDRHSAHLSSRRHGTFQETRWTCNGHERKPFGLAGVLVSRGGDFSTGRKAGRDCGWGAHSGRKRIDHCRCDIPSRRSFSGKG